MPANDLAHRWNVIDAVVIRDKQEGLSLRNRPRHLQPETPCGAERLHYQRMNKPPKLFGCALCSHIYSPTSRAY